MKDTLDVQYKNLLDQRERQKKEDKEWKRTNIVAEVDDTQIKFQKDTNMLKKQKMKQDLIEQIQFDKNRA